MICEQVHPPNQLDEGLDVCQVVLTARGKHAVCDNADQSNASNNDDLNQGLDEENPYGPSEDTLGSILTEIESSGKIPRMVEMACERLNEYIQTIKGDEDSSSDWVNIVTALVNTEDLEAIGLVNELLEGSDDLKIPWDLQRESLQALIGKLAREPPDLSGVSDPEDFLESYAGLFKNLGQYTNAKLISGILWEELFTNMSVYFVYALASLDQIDYMETVESENRIKFLHKLQRLLANSKLQIFSDGYAEVFNTPLEDALDICLDNITNSEAFLAEVNRLVNTSLTVPLYTSTDLAICTAHGMCLQKILDTVIDTPNSAFKEAFVVENLKHIFHWAIDDTPADCHQSGKPYCECEIGPFAERSRQILAMAVSEFFNLMPPETLAKLIAIWKRHKDERTLGAIVKIYPQSKTEVEEEFANFFSTLLKTNNGFPEKLYELLERISFYNCELFEDVHIDQLEARAREMTQELSSVLNIFIHIAELNTPLMVNRGEEYYKMAVNTVDVQLNVQKVNDVMSWIALSSPSKADWVVQLSEKAYKDYDKLHNPEVVNSICKMWTDIALVHKDAVISRKPLVKIWTHNPATKEKALKLLETISDVSACCCIF